jgi:hypothetical protein
MFFGDESLLLLDKTNKEYNPNTPLLTEFSYELKSTSGNQLTVTLIDPTWDYVEKLAQASTSKFSFRFGWRAITPRHDRPLASPRIGMILTDYTVDFSSPHGGAVITLFAMDTRIVLSWLPLTNFAVAPDTLISDAIEMAVHYVKTSGVPGSEGLAVRVVPPSRNTVDNKYNRGNCVSALRYIQHLMGIMEPADGSKQGSYVMTAVPSGTSGSKTSLLISPRRIEQDRAVRSYLWGRDRTGEMLSYSPKYKGSTLFGMGGMEVEVTGVDPMTKQTKKGSSSRVDQQVEGPRLDKKSFGATKCHHTAENDKKNLDRYAENRRDRVDSLVYEAEAVVEGDIDIKPQQIVKIVTLKSSASQGSVQNVRKEDILGLASGIFRVMSVSHVISPGTFRTSLSLHRTAAYDGDVPAAKTIYRPLKTPTQKPGHVTIEVEKLDQGGSTPVGFF